jgi:aminoglycoside phosphotransferase (APT) family kinase protein
LSYEAAVYEHGLRPLALGQAFRGLHVDALAEEQWLVLDFIEGWRVSRHPDPLRALAATMRWIAKLHNESAALLAGGGIGALRVYDAGYYLGWAERVDRFSGSMARRFPWLTTLCRHFDQVAGILLEAEPSMIHGEFTVHNVLVTDDDVRPVDWETAAVAAGEIDLATVVEGWPKDIAEMCEQEYQRARHLLDDPGFGARLDAARIYSLFRWYGCHEDWLEDPGSVPHLVDLGAAAQRIGII